MTYLNIQLHGLSSRTSTPLKMPRNYGSTWNSWLVTSWPMRENLWTNLVSVQPAISAMIPSTPLSMPWCLARPQLTSEEDSSQNWWTWWQKFNQCPKSCSICHQPQSWRNLSLTAPQLTFLRTSAFLSTILEFPLSTVSAEIGAMQWPVKDPACLGLWRKTKSEDDRNILFS